MSKLRKMIICLDDIPADKKWKSTKSGKTYVTVLTFDNSQPDKYGNDFSVQLDQTKEERDNNAPKVYVGNGKILGK